MREQSLVHNKLTVVVPMSPVGNVSKTFFFVDCLLKTGLSREV